MRELEPKKFQQDALDRLRGFLDDARVFGDPARAFEKWVDTSRRGLWDDYRPLSGMPEVPSVCVRLPTGGGKTLLAAYAVSVMAESTLERPYPLVLWLVPSDTIRKQTLSALKDPGHPYRRALGKGFGGQVRVFDIAEFTQLRPQDLQGNACVVVGTMQTLRVKSTEGRRVYAHNENLEGHFPAEALRTPGLEPIEEGRAGAGTPRFSFANLLKVQRPIVIVDEAHQFVTGLSAEVRERIGPSVVLEMTATPKERESNVLYRASAVELKREEMIKLPVVLTEHANGWQDALCEARKAREGLAALAGAEPEYVRPLLVVQTQNKGQEADWEAVRRHLIANEGLQEGEIAVHTGDRRELDGVDLMSPGCPITTVLTVRALMEGWDCPFAYVLCSTANLGQAQDVEQLLGRVLRMPYARRRKAPELNKAYAHVTSARFGEAARMLYDALVEQGFDPAEAREAVEQRGELPLVPVEEQAPVFAAEVAEAPEFALLPPGERAAVEVRANEAGGFAVRVRGFVVPEAAERIVRAAPEERREVLREEIARHNARCSPAERGLVFRVPRLVVEVEGQRELFDGDTLAELLEWRLLDYPADLSRFAFDEATRAYTLDLEGQSFTLTPLGSAQMELPGSELDAVGLVRWLDGRLHDPAITQGELRAWLLRAVEDALRKPGLSLAVLDRGRYVLARKLREEMDKARAAAAAKGYQELLFGSRTRVVADGTDEFAFRYPPEYTPKSWCRTGYRFGKHYYRPGPGEMSGEGEEFECACELDGMEEVKFWVRNLAGEHRAGSSFWLQTSTDRFYPDFVAALGDGRMFAVEYKGEAYLTNSDSREKEELGRLWADTSGGRAVFAMVWKGRGSRSVREQLKAALG